ncbi:MAG: DUF4956 domain-containing protein [Halioglobus sp.]|nr:DUF4956 domain-containing protein [Halioglobus sp.]
MEDQTLTFSDIFQKGFLATSTGMERYTGLEIIVNMGMSFLLGMFIFYVYKKTFQGVLYQRSFNVSLIAIAMIVTMVIMIISGNLILSLGMVGALSIVRFRTPIKDPVDLVFIFWAIAIGIGNGVGYFSLTVIGSIIMTMTIVLLTRREDEDTPYLIVLQIEKDTSEQQVVDFIKRSVERFALKSKTVNPAYTEVTAEVKLLKADTSFISELEQTLRVRKATLVSYSGDLAQT